MDIILNLKSCASEYHVSVYQNCALQVPMDANNIKTAV